MVKRRCFMVVLYRILNESQWDDFALKTFNILSVRKTSVNKIFISPAQNGERKDEKRKRGKGKKLRAAELFSFE